MWLTPTGPGGSIQGNASITDIPLIPDQRMGEKAATEAAKVLENLVQAGKEEQFNKPGNSKGLMLGEGLPPISPKLVEKIGRGEFVEMQELLPEEWLKLEKEGDAPQGSRRHQFLDIRVWALCFASYISVMANKNPRRVPDLLGYLVHMIRASMDFEGTAWAKYDNTFRRQAAATGSENWSSLNASLFSMCFTGKGKSSAKCDNCLGRGHLAGGCPFIAEQEAVPSPGWIPSGEGSPWPRCRRFNEGKCTFLDCSFRHVCARCNGSHPAVACKGRASEKGDQMSTPGQRHRGRGRPGPY